MGLNVSEQAKLRLARLVIDLRERGRSASQGAILDVLILRAYPEQIEDHFPPRIRPHKT